MSETVNRTNILAEDSAIPIARIQYHSEAGVSVVRQIRFGILFVMAWWSGPSRQGFRKLTEVVANLDPEGRLEFVVVDTDGCPELYEMSEFMGKMGGWGEVAWVRDGQIACTSGCGYHPECFEPNTRAFLKG